MEKSNRAFPLTPPSPSGRGRMCERFVSVRGMLASIPRIGARRRSVSTDTYTTERPSALSSSGRAEWFSFSLRKRVGVRGKGLLLSFTASFSAVGSSLNSTGCPENRQAGSPPYTPEITGGLAVKTERPGFRPAFPYENKALTTDPRSCAGYGQP
jgi:hypothetical protein